MNPNIKEYIADEKETLVIGCSAGPDSMALLHYIKSNYNYPLVCAHINHNVRRASKREEEYLKNFCLNNNIIFESYKITSYEQNNFENEARQKRYNFYEEVLKKYHSKYLLLAHHGDDLIETILMKIVRGSSIEGYAGIKAITKKNDFYIVRPLLSYNKDDILKYNFLNHVKYYRDHSNWDRRYTRNRYRMKVLPFLKKEDKSVHKKFLKYSQTLIEYDKFVKKETARLKEMLFINNKLNLDEFNKLDSFMQKNILYAILNNFYDNKNDIITETHINNILKLCKNSKNESIINLPQNIYARKEYNYLLIDNNINDTKEYNVLLKDYNEINNFIITKEKEVTTNGNDICRLNSKKISMPLYIRNMHNDDIMAVMGLKGHKLVKDILKENKIPSRIRNTYPVVVDSKGNIIWVPNLKKSQFNTKKGEICDIILKYCEKEEI